MRRGLRFPIRPAVLALAAAATTALAQESPARTQHGQASPALEWLLAEEREELRLPGVLEEVSGLAFGADGSLWAHDDERAAIHRLDPRTGEVLARRILGPAPVEGDFEGLAWDGEHFHLVTSTGTLVSFAPGEAEPVEEYAVRETAARSWCEVEGLAFDPDARALVLACKTVLQDDLADGLVLLEVDLPPGPTTLAGEPLPVRTALAIRGEELVRAGLPRRLSASGVARHPARDTWLIVAAREERVVEVARDGRVLGAVGLRRHPQAEGIAMAADGGPLWVADEGRGGRPRLTRYGADPDGPRRPPR